MLFTLNESVEYDYLGDVPVYKYAPNTSLSEALIVAVEEQEKSFNRLVQSMAIQEFKYFYENGQEIIYEEFDFNELKQRLVDWIKDIWNKISGWFADMIDKIKEKWGTDAKFVKKFKKKIKDNWSKIKGEGVDIGRWYTFDNLKDAVTTNPINVMEMNNKTFDTSNYQISEDEDITDQLDKLRGKLLDKTKVTSGEFSRACSEELFGEDSSERWTNKEGLSADDLVNELDKSTKTMRAVKTAYKNAKDYFNKLIAQIKRAKYKENKGQDFSTRSDNNKGANRSIKLIKGCVNIVSVYYNTMLKALKARNAQYRAIGRKVAALTGDPEKADGNGNGGESDTEGREAQLSSASYGGFGFMSF